MIADTFKIRQDKKIKRLSLAFAIFALAFGVLIFAKVNPNGFNIIWRYFGWSNQTVTIFATASILVWLMQHDKKKYFWVPLLPLAFYAFITCAYIMSAKIGIGLPYGVSLAIGAVFAFIVCALAIYRGNKKVKSV